MAVAESPTDLAEMPQPDVTDEPGRGSASPGSLIIKENSCAVAVIDLGYGDAGKGAVTDRWPRTVSMKQWSASGWVPGCAQRRPRTIGRHHTFAQFGSGTLQGLDTYLSRFMMVSRSAWWPRQTPDRSGCERSAVRVLIDAQALLTTPWHWHLNSLP